MNRIEFIQALERLLCDLSKEEREDAIQYYTDYFADAGLEKEQDLIRELGSPESVAEKLKAGLGSTAGDSAEYRETGYADARLEKKNSLMRCEEVSSSSCDARETTKKPWTNKWLKIFLIVAIFFMAFPVIVPVAATILIIICTVVFAGFFFLGGLVIGAIAVTVTGGILILYGIVGVFRGMLVPVFFSVGIGLILLSLGMAATALLVKVCIVAFPVMFRGLVNIVRRCIHRKEGTTHA